VNDRAVSVVQVTAISEGKMEHHLLDFYRRWGFADMTRVALERTL